MEQKVHSAEVPTGNITPKIDAMYCTIHAVHSAGK